MQFSKARAMGRPANGHVGHGWLMTPCRTSSNYQVTET